jgi:ATP-dependent DNA helicase RecG
MVSLLPEVSLAKLAKCLGDDYGRLDPEEVQALVTADVEGEVSNQRLRQFSQQHRTDITKTLQCLVGKGFLIKDGHGPWATYRLDGPLKAAAESGDAALTSSPHKEGSSPHKEASSPHEAVKDASLLAIAKPARDKQRLSPEEMEQVILDLCHGRYLTSQEIGLLLNRNPKNLRDRYLTPLSESGRLTRKYPKANDPSQAYTTKPDPSQ